MLATDRAGVRSIEIAAALKEGRRMSQNVHRLPSVHLGVPHRAATWMLTLLIVALVALGAILIISAGGDDATSSAPATSQSVGGPNEVTRGAAAAGSAGAATIDTGGPNEAARGQAAAGN
jgi:hypothetical protein